jgi:two-component system chemotaxis sensor kinase CheA
VSNDALLARFFTSAVERLNGMGELVSAIGGDRTAEVMRTLGRDLHTLKGEARLLGVAVVEQLAHDAEDALLGHQRGGCLGPGTQELLFEAIDTIFVCVQSLAGQKPIDDEAVTLVTAKLKQAATLGGKTSAKAALVPERAESREVEGKVAAPAPEQSTNASPAVKAATAGEAPDTTAKVAGAGEEAGPSSSLEASRKRFMQVPAEMLERIGELVTNVSGSLVRSRGYLRQLNDEANRLADAVRNLDFTQQTVSASLLRQTSNRLVDLVRRFSDDVFATGLSYEELSEAVRASRLQPFRVVTANYATFVRGAARELDKRIKLDLVGMDVRVEQRVLDEVAEPCVHLLRNSIVHGIESPQERLDAGKPAVGTIRVSAAQEGDSVRLEFADDGRGLDLERIARRAVTMGLVEAKVAAGMSTQELANLAFAPGLSTVTEVSELAGRGVGLDVVRQTIDAVGGAVHLETQRGHGTRFVLQVPVSLSIVRAMLVEASDCRFAVPNGAVAEVYWLSTKDIRHEAGRELTLYRGRLLPLIRLREVLGVKGIRDIFANKVSVLVLRSGDKLAGFVVDRCLGEREIVARPFGQFLGRPKAASGVTILEDGSLVLILHPAGLMRLGDEEHGRTPLHAGGQLKQGTRRQILYAEDSLITREYAASVLRAQGFEVTEVNDGIEALAALEHGHFDVLLTDLQMPRLDGFKLTAAVRRDPKLLNLPIVVLSTVEAPETKRMALHAGADAYLVKSQFGVESLMSTLTQVLG